MWSKPPRQRNARYQIWSSPLCPLERLAPAPHQAFLMKCLKLIVPSPLSSIEVVSTGNDFPAATAVVAVLILVRLPKSSVLISAQAATSPLWFSHTAAVAGARGPGRTGTGRAPRPPQLRDASGIRQEVHNRRLAGKLGTQPNRGVQLAPPGPGPKRGAPNASRYVVIWARSFGGHVQ